MLPTRNCPLRLFAPTASSYPSPRAKVCLSLTRRIRQLSWPRNRLRMRPTPPLIRQSSRENPKHEISLQTNPKQKYAATDGARIKHELESVFVPCLIRGSMSSDFFAKKFRISSFPTGRALPRNPEPADRCLPSRPRCANPTGPLFARSLRASDINEEPRNSGRGLAS